MSADQVSGRTTKLAWKRNPDVPAGQPALGRFDCVCGATIPDVEYCGPAVTCTGCGQTWDGRGWLVSAPTAHRYQPLQDDIYPHLHNPRCSCGWAISGYVRNGLALQYWELHEQGKPVPA